MQAESEQYSVKTTEKSLSTRNTIGTRIVQAFLKTKVFLKLKNANEKETEILKQVQNDSIRNVIAGLTLNRLPEAHHPDTKMQGGTSKGRGQFGFTLAEVLITFGIVGIVAAMTMPALIQKYKKHEAETKLKRAYSVLTQAFTLAVAKNGDIDNWAEC